MSYINLFIRSASLAIWLKMVPEKNGLAQLWLDRGLKKYGLAQLWLD
jgi:hypothetical protein